MGFCTTDYKSISLGITVPTAYAKIERIDITDRAMAYARIVVQKDRESCYKAPIDSVSITCRINKSQPIYEQIYAKAKELYFSDWEDDIVIDDYVETEDVSEDNVETEDASEDNTETENIVEEGEG